MSAQDFIEVTVIETTIYRHSYPRAELAGLLLKAGGWTQHSLEPLSTAELAEVVADERPGAVEDDLQRHGEVQGAEWRARRDDDWTSQENVSTSREKE